MRPNYTKNPKWMKMIVGKGSNFAKVLNLQNCRSIKAGKNIL